jgi:hypothetical protein
MTTRSKLAPRYPDLSMTGTNFAFPETMDWIAILQWPAMAVTVAAGWLAASSKKRRRMFGFWLFLVSNVLWIFWGYHDRAWALILLQFFLAITNVRGARTNEPRTEHLHKKSA